MQIESQVIITLYVFENVKLLELKSLAVDRWANWRVCV